MYLKQFLTLTIFFVGILFNCKAQNIFFDRNVYELKENKIFLGGYFNAFAEIKQQNNITDNLELLLPQIGIISQFNLNKKLCLYLELETQTNNKTYAFNQFNFTAKLLKGKIRAGIIAPKIGNYNVNHVLANHVFLQNPSTLALLNPLVYSDLGITYLSKFKNKEDIDFTFEFSVLQGLNENILLNNSGSVNLNFGKDNFQNYNEPIKILNNNNNAFMLSGNVNLKQDSIFIVGASFLTGRFNNVTQIDTFRNLVTFNFYTDLFIGKARFKGEAVFNFIDTPKSLNELLAKEQFGVYFDLSYPLVEFKNRLNSKIIIAYRYSFTDLHIGFFDSTLEKIGNKLLDNCGALNFELSKKTTFKFNVCYSSKTDLLNNPSTKTLAYQFGISSWF